MVPRTVESVGNNRLQCRRPGRGRPSGRGSSLSGRCYDPARAQHTGSSC